MMRQTISSTYALIRSDFMKRCEYEKKAANALQLIKFLLYPAFVVVLLYRLQRFFYTNHLGIIAGIIKWLNQVIFTVDIASDTVIGPRMMVLHASFIVIGERVTIGRDFILVHNNSVMASPFYAAGKTLAAPVLGDDVILGGGAQVTGNLTLGNNVQVSMNTSVEESFGDDAVLFGVPARNLSKHNEGA